MWRSDSERITELERAVETLTRRVAALEASPSSTSSALKRGTKLFVDYHFWKPLEQDEFKVMKKQTFENALEKLGFVIVNDKKEAKKIAIVLFTAGVRYDKESEVRAYLKNMDVQNTFVIFMFYGALRSSKFDLGKPFKGYLFQSEAGVSKDIPFGFVDLAPNPIASGICSTCLSSATGSNTCNMCQETFCGMECFAYGHKGCYQ